MDILLGLMAGTAILVFYALAQRRRWVTLAVAGTCVVGSAYSFLLGAWPLGAIEAIWAIIVTRKCWLRAKP
ncbi:MAG: hypothetical protein ACHQK9_18200 [Reyranellales bacterium]